MEEEKMIIINELSSLEENLEEKNEIIQQKREREVELVDEITRLNNASDEQTEKYNAKILELESSCQAQIDEVNYNCETQCQMVKNEYDIATKDADKRAETEISELKIQFSEKSKEYTDIEIQLHELNRKFQDLAMQY